MKNRLLTYILLSLVFISLATPLILKSTIDIFDELDEFSYHYPTILAFKDQFPNLDLTDYRSATTPLYHITLAILAFGFTSGIVQLRFINLFISLACLLVIYSYLSRRGKIYRGLFFTVIIMLSPYFLGPAVRLSTDNMALLFALLSIYSMDTTLYSSKRFLLTNTLILLTILTRQVYAWLIGSYLLSNLQKYKGKQPGPNWMQIILPALIPTIGLAYFLFLWRGPTPPDFASHTAQNLNWDALIFIVSLVGLFAGFFIFWLFEIYKTMRLKPHYIAILVGLGVVFLLLHPVSNEYLDRSLRGGSLWLVASYLPNFLSSSIVFWILFPVGLVFLYVMAQYLALKHNLLMIICFSLWLLTNIINIRIYQKYYEPFILFSIGNTLIPLDTEEKWHYWVGPAVLLAGFIGITLVRFF